MEYSYDKVDLATAGDILWSILTKSFDLLFHTFARRVKWFFITTIKIFFYK